MKKSTLINIYLLIVFLTFLSYFLKLWKASQHNIELIITKITESPGLFIYFYCRHVALSYLNNKVVNISLAVLIHFSLIYIFFKLYKFYFPFNSYQEQNLSELDFGYFKEEKIRNKETGIERTIKIYVPPYYKDKDEYIEIGTKNLKLTKEEVQSKLESLSSTLKLNLIEVKEKYHKKGFLIFRISKDNFAKITIDNSFNEFYKLNLGKNATGKELIIDLVYKPFILMIGKNGSGKTELAKQYCNQIINNCQLSGHEIELVIAEPKGLDWEDYKEKGCTYINVQTSDGKRELIEKMKTVLLQKEASKEIVAKYGKNSKGDVSAEYARRNGYSTPLKRQIWIFDECSSYLTDAEVDKDAKKLNLEIIQLTDKFVKELRASGIILFFLNQTLEKTGPGALKLNLVQCHTQLFNGISDYASRTYCDGLVEKEPRVGLWFNAVTKEWLKVPFRVNNIFDNLKKEKEHVTGDESACNQVDESDAPSELSEKEYIVIRSIPDSPKYKDTHVIISISNTAIQNKLLPKDLSDEEIIQKYVK